MVDLEALNGLEIFGKVKSWQDDDFIPAPGSRVSDHHQAVDVGERKKAKFDLGLDALFSSRHVFVEAVLHSVGNNILVRYHDSFLLPCQQKHRVNGCKGLTGRPEVPLE
jgi:hypothetical protein